MHQVTMPDLEAKAKKYVGKWVESTYYVGTRWLVREAYVHCGVVCLSVQSEDGQSLWRTDTEHATMSRNQRDPGPEATIDPRTREVYWEDDE